MTALHTNVPAEYDTAAGTSTAATASTIAATGSVEKCAARAPSTRGRPSGRAPVSSGMRASARLIATRSGVIAVRPAASPRLTTTSGWCARMSSRIRSHAAAYSTGRTSVTTRA